MTNLHPSTLPMLLCHSLWFDQGLIEKIVQFQENMKNKISRHGDGNGMTGEGHAYIHARIWFNRHHSRWLYYCVARNVSLSFATTDRIGQDSQQIIVSCEGSGQGYFILDRYFQISWNNNNLRLILDRFVRWKMDSSRDTTVVRVCSTDSSKCVLLEPRTYPAWNTQ